LTQGSTLQGIECQFVIGGNQAGPVPQVAAILSRADHRGTIGARTGIQRDQYTLTPGLYCVGRPTGDSSVLVTANYKLTFDAL